MSAWWPQSQSGDDVSFLPTQNKTPDQKNLSFGVPRSSHPTARLAAQHLIRRESVYNNNKVLNGPSMPSSNNNQSRSHRCGQRVLPPYHTRFSIRHIPKLGSRMPGILAYRTKSSMARDPRQTPTSTYSSADSVNGELGKISCSRILRGGIRVQGFSLSSRRPTKSFLLCRGIHRMQAYVSEKSR